MAAAVPGAVKDDRLGWALSSCPAFEGEVHAWFEYGLMACYGSASDSLFGQYAAAQVTGADLC